MAEKDKNSKGSGAKGAKGRAAPSFSGNDQKDTEDLPPVGSAADVEVLDADRQPAGKPKALG